ncbi:BT_3928 family protein [Marinilabilia sp.]|uniref:BT_3928 family protein n=1 Tax=Marinilabilia sp. TaxID=2021252 RepID=UPI0025BAD72F|nr:BT_3928 family protein [Marinilabilia sp.]
MWNILRFLSRIIVGATFLFSGFVKAVDPVGGAIKFHDYFQAFSMDWLIPLSMPASIALATLEFLIGAILLFNVFSKRIAVTAFYFMAFFTVLTLGLALFNPVTDCGCFGDALILTNWQTFWKNVIIMIFATILFLSRKQLKSPYAPLMQNVFLIVVLVYTVGISIYSIRHLPLVDFRPYSIGSNIPAGMTIPEDAPQPEYKTTFILEKNGTQKEFNEDNYPYQDTTWVFVDSKTKLISKGYTPPIHDFVLQHPENGNITDQLLGLRKPLLLAISPDISKVDKDHALKLAQLQQVSAEQDFPFYVVTSSTIDDAESFNDRNKTHFEFLQGDETNLKTIIRSNPGLLLIVNGTVAGKWHYNDLPKAADMKQPLSTALKQQQNNRTRMILLGHAFFIALLSIFILKTSKNKNQ